MKHALITVSGLILIAVHGMGAEYYVATTGNDANAGTASAPWRTIQRAANVMRGGDTAYVRPGTYNERVALTADGSAGNYITFKADGAIMRGFDISSASYIRIIGFEITHTSTTWARAFVFDGTCTRVEILDNYMHHIFGEGGAIRAITGESSYVTIRGNTFYYMGYVPGVWELGNGHAVSLGVPSHHWLVEYNRIQRAGDFFTMDSANVIVRNNWIHDYSDAYFSSGGGHVDTFQPFRLRNHLYEANVCGDNVEAHSHLLQIRDPGTNVIFRGNVAYNYGSYALQAGAVDHVVIYNNTFYDLGNVSAGAPFGYNAEGSDPSINNSFFNNIIHTATGSSLLTADGGSQFTAANNLGWRTGTHPSLVSRADPLFVNISAKQFYLQGTSPAINAGKAVTTVTSANGSGTSFQVSDASLLFDGWGMVEGDVIQVGSGSPVRIVSISGNTLTTDRSTTWSTGMNVYWRAVEDAAPDIGAYEHRSGGYSLGVGIVSPAPGASVSGPTTVTAAVTNANCVRFVAFYANGIPFAQVFGSPYTATWNATTNGAVTLEARAFPLYAATNLVQIARVTVNGTNDQTRPAPPSNLRLAL